MSQSRILASIEISRPVVTVESYGAGVISSSVKHINDVTVVLPLASLQWVTVYCEAEVDFRGLNKFPKEFQFTVDEATAHFVKSALDSTTTTDVHTIIVVKKNPNELLHTAESRSVTYRKPITDLVDATDDLYGLADADDQETMWLAKSISVEAQHASDVRKSSLSKPLQEAKSVADVRNTSFGKNKTDATLTAETRTTVVQKKLDDLVDAGDEINGAFHTDDGETMFLVKPFYDESINGDVAAIGTEKPTEDSFSQSDFVWPFDLGKGIADTNVSSEIYLFYTEKPLTDTSEALDAHSNLTSRPVHDISNAQLEGPNQLVDYIAQDFFVGDYCATGLPAFYFAKARSDLASTTEIIAKGSSKPLAEAIASGDSAGKLTTKNPSDSVSKSDESHTAFGKSATDSISKSDAKTTFVSKVVSEIVVATDDFHGAANADDDETMSFVTSRAEAQFTDESHTTTLAKPKSDQVASSEFAAKGPSKPISDSVSKSDVRTNFVGLGKVESTSTTDVQRFGVGKAASETTLTSETKTFATGIAKVDQATSSDKRSADLSKPLADSTVKSDSTIKGSGKSLTDYGQSVDNLTNYVNKYLAEVVDATDDFYGIGNTDDDQTMSFVTSRSESVSKSDAANRGVNKALADTASKSDSGSFRMTSYCDVLYFTSDFVGITSTF